MTTGYKGRDFVLKIGDGATTEVFTAIGGIRANRLSLNNNPVDITNMTSTGSWQEMLSDGGTRQLEISGDGVSDNQTQFAALKALAMSATPKKNFQLVNGRGDTFQGNFVVSNLELSGAQGEAETFSVTLVNNGAVTFTAGA